MSVASTDHYISRGIMNVIKNDDELKNTNPLRYYLENVDNIKIMGELMVENRALYNKVLRMNYIISLKTKEPLRKCPHCHATITNDEWGEEYCPQCGAITRNNYPYMAGQLHDLPYGLKL